ncbi:unnamed protein product [Parnassius mnemosyne]|uniref:Uncharacterized protein n=1 Tax=Parnassius mnemosyne TaxID=213953 RepID=A0AAV1L2H4_9NEOP
MISTLNLLLVFGVGSLAAPADDPVRIDLPVYEQPQGSSYVQLAEPLEKENHPQPKIVKDNSIANNLVSGQLHTSNLLDNKLASGSPPIGSVNYGGGLFSAPVTTLEGALLEREGLGSKTLSVKENVQGIVAGLFQPKPIVDTIKEEEKYGNSGDKFYSAGRAIVSGAEGVSNIFNSVLEIPGSIIKKITRAATEKLNNLGGKLIGL